MRKLEPTLDNRLRTLLTTMECELVGYEWLSTGRRALFRLYVDKPGGVTIDDCSRISRQVGAMFDVEDCIPGGYVLEVSSPGIDRPLFELAQYTAFVGRKIKLSLSTPHLERRHYKGVLLGATKEAVRLLLDEGVEVSIPFLMILKANVVGDV